MTVAKPFLLGGGSSSSEVLKKYTTERRLKSIAKSGKTSTEVKNRWNEKTYKRIMVSLRREDDADLLEWFEKNKDKYGPTEIFRAGIETLKNEG